MNSFRGSKRDKTCAPERFAAVKVSIKTLSLSDAFSTRTDHKFDKMIAHNMASRFTKDDEDFGKIFKEVNKLIPSYIEAASDYELNKNRKLL